MSTLLSIFARLVDTLFPESCRGCGAGGAVLCERCLASAPRAQKPEHVFITAVFDYHNPAIRKAIWNFKYRNARGIAQLFGGTLHEEIIGDLGDALYLSKKEAILLVPVPLHAKRFRERGYNQSELLAREIIKHDTEHIFELAPNALMRTRATNAQVKKEKRAARFENLRGAFAANSARVRGKHVMLIDDVTTTGATLAEARKALLKAGAKTVRAYTIAH